MEVDRTEEGPTYRITNSSIIKLSSCTYDLSSPREWLEYYESIGTQGAYTVVRCDYILNNGRWRIWGEEFHLNRLAASFKKLQTLPGIKNQTDEDAFDEVYTTSKEVMELLLQEAAILPSNDEAGRRDEELFYTVMTTLLWQPEGDYINVRGHTYSTFKTSGFEEYTPEPLKVSIALTSKVENMRPNRFENLPEAKLSSWCRRRRPLEKRFKPTGVDDVILTRFVEGEEVLLLEGLTSNLFAVFPNRTLRTPDTDFVLGGYARYLVLEFAERCGLKVEIGPLRLADSSLWNELFLTSSVRLIVPVQELLTYNDSTKERELLWSERQSKATPVWQRLHDELCNNAL